MSSTIQQIAAQTRTDLPILLFELRSRFDGSFLRIAQVPIEYDGEDYEARVLRVDGLDIKLEDAELGVAAISNIALELGNVDGAASAWDDAHIFKNADISVRFVFAAQNADTGEYEVTSSDSLVIFRGLCNDPDLENETVLRLTAFNRFNSPLNLFPPVRVQQLSPTVFPPEGGKDSDDAATTDKDAAIFRIINSESDRSRLDWPCGYGPIRGLGVFGGSNPVGNYLVPPTTNADIFAADRIGHTGLSISGSLEHHIVVIYSGTGAGQSRRIASNTSNTIFPANSWTVTPDGTSAFAVVFGFCGRTKTDCQQRGMYSTDNDARTTRRFRGISFTPADFKYRPWKGKKRLTETDTNNAKYNQALPYVFGDVRKNCLVLFSQTDRQVRAHLLVCAGEIDALSDLIIEGKLIPQNQPVSNQADITGNWFARLGARGGNTEHARFPGHDPYGMLAVIYLDTLPPQFVSGGSFDASVRVRGTKVESFDKDGASLGFAFSDCPGWTLLHILKETGWSLEDVYLPSWHSYGVYAAQPVATNLGTGQQAFLKRFARNFVFADQRPVADVIAGIAGGARILPSFNADGKLSIECENCLAGTTFTTAVAAPGVQFARVDDGAGIAVDARLLLKDASGNTEIVTVLSVRNVGSAFEFEADFTRTYEIGDSIEGLPAFHFSDSEILFDEGAVQRDLSRRSLPSADIPNEYVTEFQNQFRNQAADSVTLIDTREATEMGARLTAQIPGEGFPTPDACVRIARLQLFKGHGRRTLAGTIASRGNLFVELSSSVKGVLIRIGAIVTLSWALKGWVKKKFRVVAIAGAPDETAPFWQIRYVLREHDDQWYRDVNGSMAVAPGIPINLDPAGIGPVGGGGGGGDNPINPSDGRSPVDDPVVPIFD